MVDQCKHVVWFSGGIGSWGCAKRVASCYGLENLFLVFCDTNFEDEDLYRFIAEASVNVLGDRVGDQFITISDGRTPWQVCRDERFLANSRVDPCSKILKREMSRRWLEQNCDKDTTTCYVGIDWSEAHRFTGGRGKPGMQARNAAEGWRYKAPMLEEPHLSKGDMLRWLDAEGIDSPRLYDQGFIHNNCGGFCFKMGQASAANLLLKKPDFYAYNEVEEQGLIAFLGRDDIGIMEDRRGGVRRPLTMKDFRERFQAMTPEEQRRVLRIGGAGGCGCYSSEGE